MEAGLFGLMIGAVATILTLAGLFRAFSKRREDRSINRLKAVDDAMTAQADLLALIDKAQTKFTPQYLESLRASLDPDEHALLVQLTGTLEGQKKSTRMGQALLVKMSNSDVDPTEIVAIHQGTIRIMVYMRKYLERFM